MGSCSWQAGMGGTSTGDGRHGLPARAARPGAAAGKYRRQRKRGEWVGAVRQASFCWPVLSSPASAPMPAGPAEEAQQAQLAKRLTVASCEGLSR